LHNFFYLIELLLYYSRNFIKINVIDTIDI